MEKVHFKKGISIIEIVISAALIVTAVTVTINVFRSFLILAQDNVTKTHAALLAEEGSEAIQLIRDSGWASNIDTLTLDTTYYLYWSGSAYSLTTTPQTANGFTREISFSAVDRDDSSGNIVESGTTDNNTRLYDITIYSNDDLSTPVFYTEGLIHNVYE